MTIPDYQFIESLQFMHRQSVVSNFQGACLAPKLGDSLLSLVKACTLAKCKWSWEAWQMHWLTCELNSFYILTTTESRAKI